MRGTWRRYYRCHVQNTRTCRTLLENVQTACKMPTLLSTAQHSPPPGSRSIEPVYAKPAPPPNKAHFHRGDNAQGRVARAEPREPSGYRFFAPGQSVFFSLATKGGTDMRQTLFQFGVSPTYIVCIPLVQRLLIIIIFVVHIRLLVV